MSQLVRVLKRRNIPFGSSRFLNSVGRPMQLSRCCKWSDIKDMRVKIDEEAPIESDGPLVLDSRTQLIILRPGRCL